jgi:GT2 family glycosyltransferase
MKISVIIVNYNVKFYLYQCLDSALKSLKNIQSEVFVVDNNSTDGSVAFLKPFFPSVKFIENTDNVGFSRANNQAIEQSSGEYILLLNPDTVIGESALSLLCKFMDENQQVGALGVKMLDGGGNFLPESKRGFPSPWNSFTKMSGLAKLFPKSKIFGGYHLRYLDENERHEVEVLAGAFMLLRRTAIEKAGSLDNAFFMYGEDIDLSYRIGQAGFSVVYYPVPIIHYKGESTKKDLRYVKHFYEAMLIFFNKHYPHSNRLFKIFIRLAIVLTGAFSALQKILHLSPSENKKLSQIPVTFNVEDITYDEIIQTMNANTEKNVNYRIAHPAIGVVVSGEEVVQ